MTDSTPSGSTSADAADAYREHFAEFANNLIVMGSLVKKAMMGASRALFEADLVAAEDVLSSVEEFEDVRLNCEEQAFTLLGLQAPGGPDLRRVVSGTYIVEDLARMNALSVHIAKIARRRHPEVAVPEDVVPYFAEMSRQCVQISDTLQSVLETYDPDQALELAREDDAIDDLHHHIFLLTTQRPWPHSVTAAVDATLLSRFFERYSDHAVKIGTRVVYLATGMRPEEYIRGRTEREREETFTRHFDEIQQRYGGLF